MSRPEQGDDSNDSSFIRRGRGGRSRKYPRTDVEAERIPQVDHGNTPHIPPGFRNPDVPPGFTKPDVPSGFGNPDVAPGFGKQNLRHRDNGDGVLNPDVPPGFRKRNQHRRDNGDSVLNPDVPPGSGKHNQCTRENGDGVLVPGIMVGQVVEGVIEAEFDGGFLLSIGCGKLKGVAGGILRGVAFRCRRARTSANNGVAPDVKKRRRDYRNHNFSPKVGTWTSRKAKAAKLVNPNSQTVSPFEPEFPPGFFVPVVLKPVNLSDSITGPTQGGSSNGVTTSTQGGPRPADDASTFDNQVPPDTPEMYDGPSEMRMLNKEDYDTDSEQTFSDDALQAAEPILNSHSRTIECPFGNFRVGEMTKLLQKVLQDSMRAKQRTQAEKAGGSKRKFDERETDNGAKDDGNSPE